MKKLGCLLLSVIMLFLLTACGGQVCALPKKLDALYLYRNPVEPFDRDLSCHMQNVMVGNRVYVGEDALYTLELDGDSRPLLASYGLENERISGFEILRENCVPRWITEHEGVLYYINVENNDAIESIELENLEHSVLAEGPCSYLQISGGKLFFCNGEQRFCSAGLDGKNVQILFEERCCYPFLAGNILFYQSEDEGEILKLRLMDTGKEIELTAGAAYAPVVVENRLFYTGEGWIKSMGLDGMSPALCSGDVVTGAAEYIYEDGWWYARAVSTGYGVQQWRCALPDGKAEDYPYTGYAYCDFAGGGWRVDPDYFADGRLRAFIIYAPEGGRAEYLYGKITYLG